MDIMSRKERSHRMSLIRGRDTTPELMVRSAIHRLGYRFRLHRRDLPGKPDIVFPARRRAVFIDGCFWHGHHCRIGHLPSSNISYWSEKINNTRQRDARTRKLLRKQGWKVLVLRECEMKDMNIVTKKLIRFLEDGRI